MMHVYHQEDAAVILILKRHTQSNRCNNRTTSVLYILEGGINSVNFVSMKFPSYIQHDGMDCGATCLQIISKFHGRYFSQQTLRELCHITRNGVSLRGISDAAETLGYRTIATKLTWEQLKNDAMLPCIVHWNQSHFIVVYNIKNKHNKDIVYVSDPAEGLLEYPVDQFLKSWIQITNQKTEVTDRGIALLLAPKPEFYRKIGDTENRMNLWYLVNYLRPYKSYIIQVMFAMLTASIINMLLPYLTQSIVDTGISTNDINFIVIVLIAQLVLTLGQMANNAIRNWLMLHITTRISITLISDFLYKF